MRNNLPVSQREYAFPAGRLIVSTTDLKGRITYCNQGFIELSGYSGAELKGQPHNLIRHPDVPAEAFRDLWDTIGRGLPWTGTVKNRRKNGDHYWVCANVTPLMDGGKPIGYLSVRNQCTRGQIEGAEALYALMRDEQQRGTLLHRLHAGELMPTSRLARWRQRAGLGGLWRGVLGLAGRANMLAGIERWANRLAAGDLSNVLGESAGPAAAARVQRALRQLGANLLAVVRDVRDSVARMQASIVQVAAGNQDLSARTETLAGSLQQTASSVDQITGAVRRTAEVMHEATRVAGEACDAAALSGAQVEQVRTSMEAIMTSSSRIGEITSVIDGIAFQTNILALNAAVEAARAGEQGRGFAVVAQEVRALAQRSATAAREIKALIESSAIMVRSGAQQADSAVNHMVQARAAVDRVRDMIGDIDTGTQQQLGAVSAVNEAVARMDSVAQQNAALVLDLAANTAELRGCAQDASDALAIFRLDAGEVTLAGRDAVQLRRQAKSAPAPVLP